MRKRKALELLVALLAVPMLMQAQFWGGGISKKAQQQLIEQEKADNRISYVNTKAPGVHKEYDPERGYDVWRDATGSLLCPDKNMRPMEQMKLETYYNGPNNDPDNPQPPKGWVDKVWDEETGCYVYKDKTGSFLGCDKPSAEKQKDWLKQKEKGWLAKGNVPSTQSTAAPQSQGNPSGGGTARNPEDEDDYIEAGSYDGEIPENYDPRTLVITTDAQMRQAEAALAEAKAAIRMAQSQGVNVGDYADLSAIDILEQKINEYKRKRSQMK